LALFTAAARAASSDFVESSTNGVAPLIWRLSPPAATSESTMAPAVSAAQMFSVFTAVACVLLFPLLFIILRIEIIDVLIFNVHCESVLFGC
jgi:hypothetical protein